MKPIVREFYRAHFSVPLRFFTVSAICAAVFWLTGTYSRENTCVLALIASAFLAALTLWALFDVLTAPRRFKKRLNGISENVREEIISGFNDAPKLGKRWFFESCILYFANRRIQLLRFDEMRSADLKGNRLFISMENGESVPMPFGAAENPAVIVAALRSKNGRLKATIDGRNVDFDKKKKN